MSRSTFLVFCCALLAGCSLFGGGNDHNGDAGNTTCTVAADCSNGQVCAANRCIAAGTVGLGGMCSANRDCESGMFCAPSGTCDPAGTGVVGDPCESGAECSRDEVCQLYGFGGECVAGGTVDVGGSCTASSDCLAGLSCGAANTCVRSVDAYPPFTGVACAPDAAPFKVFFQVPRPNAKIPDFYRLPFPNDARVKDDGTLDLSDFPRPGPTILGFDLVALYADTLSADFDGFSSVANVTFRFSKAFDFNSVGTNGANVHFIDITTPGDPSFGTDRGRSFSYDSAKGLYECQNTFQVGPSRDTPLLPGHKYAAYLTSDIRSVAGEAPVLDDDLAAVLGDVQPADATLAKVWTEYTNFRTFLAQNALTPANVAGVAVFTVQDTTGKMKALDTAVEASPLPTLSNLTLCDGVNASPCAIAGDTQRVCGDSSGAFWEIHGRVSIPNFQQGTLPYELPPDGGAIPFVNGVPQQQGTLNVCFALTIPKTTMPGGGWPLVVHAHGTGGSFKDAVDSGIAQSLATASTPMATLTFDGVGHGERRGASTRSPDSLVFNVVNPRAARDNSLQGAVDVIQTLRVAQVAPFTVASAGSIHFDPARTYYFGHSQGSNVGIPAIAETSLAKAAIFSGAGSYLTQGILSKTSPVNAKAGLSALIGEDLTNGHPVMVLWQTFFDRIDPLNYDGLILASPPAGVASKSVYMSWGQNDTFSPEGTLVLTAKAMRLPLVNPTFETVNGMAPINRPVSGNKTGGDNQVRTAGAFQYTTDGTYDGHFVSTRNPAAVTDWVNFLTSAATAGTPTVP